MLGDKYLRAVLVLGLLRGRERHQRRRRRAAAHEAAHGHDVAREHALVQRDKSGGRALERVVVGVHERRLPHAVPGLEAAPRLEAQQLQACAIGGPSVARGGAAQALSGLALAAPARRLLACTSYLAATSRLPCAQSRVPAAQAERVTLSR